jgi:hypothetical protein
MRERASLIFIFLFLFPSLSGSKELYRSEVIHSISTKEVKIEESNYGIDVDDNIYIFSAEKRNVLKLSRGINKSGNNSVREIDDEIRKETGNNSEAEKWLVEKIGYSSFLAFRLLVDRNGSFCLFPLSPKFKDAYAYDFDGKFIKKTPIPESLRRRSLLFRDGSFYPMNNTCEVSNGKEKRGKGFGNHFDIELKIDRNHEKVWITDKKKRSTTELPFSIDGFMFTGRSVFDKKSNLYLIYSQRLLDKTHDFMRPVTLFSRVCKFNKNGELLFQWPDYISDRRKEGKEALSPWEVEGFSIIPEKEVLYEKRIGGDQYKIIKWKLTEKQK